MVHPVDRIRATASRHLEGRRVVLAVTGSIAAVRAVELARELVRHGADVLVVMTPAACGIITPDAIEFAIGRPPVTRLTGQVEHVRELGEGGDADLLLVAPATANTVAKMALGIDDTAVTTFASVALGAGRPVLVAPAMHGVMEDNPPTRAHVQALLASGVRFIRPLYEEGKAKLAPIDEIVAEVKRALGPQDLAGQHVLVVSGASSEPLDTVRSITNRSSGKTGLALAHEAHRRGAEVTVLTSDPEAAWPPGSTVIAFTSVPDLLATWESRLARDRFAWILMPAALSDYAAEAAPGKLSSEEPTRHFELKRLPKVLERARALHPDARLIGWKLQDRLEEAVAAARTRIAAGIADAFVANAAATMGSDEVKAALVVGDAALPLGGTKAAAAERLWELLLRHVAGAPGEEEALDHLGQGEWV